MNRYKLFGNKSQTNFNEVAKLFIECGWGQKYSQQSANEILSNNSLVIFAKDVNGKLVGILRILNEGAFSSNIMDIVVHPKHSSEVITNKMVAALKKQFKGRRIYVQEMQESNNYFFINRGFKLRSQVQSNQIQSPWFAKLFNY